ncbi:unnamed protein product, partial [Amoebophrya sp. A120]|eukprot:GSA120T00020926001.1
MITEDDSSPADLLELAQNAAALFARCGRDSLCAATRVVVERLQLVASTSIGTVTDSLQKNRILTTASSPFKIDLIHAEGIADVLRFLHLLGNVALQILLADQDKKTRINEPQTVPQRLDHSALPDLATQEFFRG